MNERHAVVLAGGRGTRLLPYTTTIPKPLMPIGDECAILEIILRQLARAGFPRVTIAIGHLGELIRAYVGTGGQWGLEVDYVAEAQPLGTMGPVVATLARLPEHFLVMNGDILTDLDYAALLDDHVGARPALTVATCRREIAVDFGVLRVDQGRIIEFTEKPVLSYEVSMGVYALSRSTLADYPPGEPLGFDQLVIDLLQNGRLPSVYPFDGYWLDIGRPEDYDRANAGFGEVRARLLPGP